MAVPPWASMPTQTGTAPETLTPDPVRSRCQQGEPAPGERDRTGSTYQAVAGVAIAQRGAGVGECRNSHNLFLLPFLLFPSVNKPLEFHGMGHAVRSLRCQHGLISEVLLKAEGMSSGGSSPIPGRSWASLGLGSRGVGGATGWGEVPSGAAGTW